MSQLCLYHHITCLTSRGLWCCIMATFTINRTFIVIYGRLWMQDLAFLCCCSWPTTIHSASLHCNLITRFHSSCLSTGVFASSNIFLATMAKIRPFQSSLFKVGDVWYCWPGQGPKEGIRVSAAPLRCTSERSGHFSSVGITGSMLTWC